MDKITFGHRPDGTPLTWLVLQRTPAEAFLLAEECCVRMPYDTSSESEKTHVSYWKDNPLRAWLNETFYQEWFTEEEQERILITPVEDESWFDPEMTGEHVVKFVSDHIFLLDRVVLERFLPTGKKRCCNCPTEDEGYNDSYWLKARSPGLVNNDGSFSPMAPGWWVPFSQKHGVRPAIRINVTGMEAEKEKKKPASSALVEFGHYSDGEKIKWRILERNDRDALLLSDDIMEYAWFDENSIWGTWRDSTLRTYLNGDFYENSFDKSEKSLIVKCHLPAAGPAFMSWDIGKQTDTSKEYETTDKVFLLSADEVRKFLWIRKDRKANLRGTSEGSFSWHLRNKGDKSQVAPDGRMEVNCPENGVRPAIRVKLSGISVTEPVVQKKKQKEQDGIRFGHTPDGSVLTWKALKTEGGRTLLISEYILMEREFEVNVPPVSWETCSLRKYLNGEFIKTCFNAEEQSHICKTSVPAVKSAGRDYGPDKNTKDRLFIFSVEEAKAYFPDEKSRMAKARDYSGNLTWWLRNHGREYYQFTVVNPKGGIDGGGYGQGSGYGQTVEAGVRPAMWVDTEAITGQDE